MVLPPNSGSGTRKVGKAVVNGKSVELVQCFPAIDH